MPGVMAGHLVDGINPEEALGSAVGGFAAETTYLRANRSSGNDGRRSNSATGIHFEGTLLYSGCLYDSNHQICCTAMALRHDGSYDNAELSGVL